jgi:phosphoribosylamine--glycine ligase
MAKYRIISKSGDGVAIGYRIQQEGHSCDFYLKDEHGKHLYEGILPRVDDWRKGISKEMILVWDMVGMGKEADELKKQGYRIFGASEIADNLELDRGFGLDIASDVDIEIPHSEDFQDYEKAKEFLEKQEDDAGWVFKPEKNKEGIKTFVSKNLDEIIGMLDYFAEVWTDGVDFILQKVVDGIEVSSEAWFVNGEYIPDSYNNTWETKRFMNDDLSCNTGCMSSIVKFNACPKLFDKTFKKLAPWLKLHKYTGALDINCIIDYEGTPYMLEWTARMGYSAIYAFCALLDMPISEFIATIAEGKIPDIEPSDEWAGALRLTIPPYPLINENETNENKGIPISNIDEYDHYWPLDVMMNKNKLVCSGFDGVILEITDSHPDLSVLWEGIYDLARIVTIPDVQYRTDVYENAMERIDNLKSLSLFEGEL